MTAGDGCPFVGGGTADVTSNDIIEISDPNNPIIDTNNDISVISLNFGVTAGGGCPLAGEVAADVKSDNIIEISGPYNLKIDTHNDIFVIYFEFVLQRAVGDPLTAGGAADIKSKIIIENHQNRHPVNPDAISFEFWWGGGCPLAGGGHEI